MTTDQSTIHDQLGILGAAMAQRGMMLKGRGQSQLNALTEPHRYDGDDPTLAQVSADALVDALRTAAQGAPVPPPARRYYLKGQVVAQIDGRETPSGYVPGDGMEVLARIAAHSDEPAFEGSAGVMIRGVLSQTLGFDITTLDPLPERRAS